MERDTVTLIIAGASAFTGALTGVAALTWWLGGRFNTVYARIAEHELADEKRFHALQLSILDVTLQAQAAALALAKQQDHGRS